MDDQGAFAPLKENLRFSEPLQGSRVRQNKKIKIPRKGYLYFWWTIRDSKPDLVAKMTQK